MKKFGCGLFFIFGFIFSFSINVYACTSLPTPIANEPTNGALGVSLQPELKILVLLVPGIFPGCEHDATQWQLSTDENFSSIVIDTDFSESSTISLGGPGFPVLVNKVKYWWRARIKDNDANVVSIWSEPRWFETGTPDFCLEFTPTLLEPIDGSTVTKPSPLKFIIPDVPENCKLGAYTHMIFTNPNSPNSSKLFNNVIQGYDNKTIEFTIDGEQYEPGVTYYWRAHLFFNSEPNSGIWSRNFSFTIAEDSPETPEPGTQPEADFSFSPTEPTVDQTITFNDLSTDPDNDIETWLWNFGDGGTSSIQNPSHTYSFATDYPVRLTVTDSEGNSNTITKTVTVSNGDETPGEETSLTIPQAIARLISNDPSRDNADQFIGDREIIQAITFWILSGSVTGTDNLKINDPLILTLITMWITQTLID